MTLANSVLRTFKIRFARVHGQLGLASLGGFALMLVALGIAASAWEDRRATIESSARMKSAPDVPLPVVERFQASPPAAASSMDKLPVMSDLPGLLTSLEAIAVDNRLGWSAADYRLVPASERTPTSVEIRTRFLGTYPQIRRMVSQVLDRVPAVTFRHLSFTRASSDTDEVEAKVVFAIFLADEPVSSGEFASAHQDADASRTNPP